MIKDNPGFRAVFAILIWIAFCVLILHSLAESAPRLHLEKEYQKPWCAAHSGKTEVVLDDRTRVDCLTGDYAIEFDFANKAMEAIGQAGYYASKTGRRPGIVLILEHEADHRFLLRLLLSIQDDNRRWAVWVVTPETLNK